ncbi:MAG TPA: CAP domain-containing protein, partial [Polyangiaceae bacterium]|nr:CAP domain-containing protein [Polyangiaceae bacterium]
AGSGGAGGGNGGTYSGGASGGAACPEQSPQLCGMTLQHNQARASVTPVPATPLPSMTWDTTLAAAAQTWAEQCNFSHNAAGYGQNLYASAGSGPPSPAAVVTSWVSEAAAYDYAANACSGTCGHYTQVVWRNSNRVGCGFKYCSTNTPLGAQFPNWYLVVCDYSPAGNNGSRPY